MNQSLDYFRERSAPDSNGCWVWQRHVARHGYGVMRSNDGTALAHRMAWKAAHNEAIGERLVLHTCDNPRCVNPAHLYAGTHRQNMADRNRKGRARGGSNPGERHPAARLTGEQVREIRSLVGRVPQSAIARKFGVSQSHVCCVATGKRWKHV